MRVTAAEPNCVIIPMADEGEIMVGNLNFFLGYLDNIHEAEITIRDNPAENCMLQLDWKLKQRKDFIFYYINGTKIPINDFKPNCQSVLDKPFVNVEEAFKDWNEFMWVTLQSDVTLHLFNLKSEDSTVNPETVKQPFISNMTLNFNQATSRHGYSNSA